MSNRVEEKEVYKEQVINGLAAIVRELKELRREVEELKKVDLEIIKLLNTISYRYWLVNKDKLSKENKENKENNKFNGKKERAEDKERVLKEKPYYEDEIL